MSWWFIAWAVGVVVGLAGLARAQPMNRDGWWIRSLGYIPLVLFWPLLALGVIGTMLLDLARFLLAFARKPH